MGVLVRTVPVVIMLMAQVLRWTPVRSNQEVGQGDDDGSDGERNDDGPHGGQPSMK